MVIILLPDNGSGAQNYKLIGVIKKENPHTMGVFKGLVNP
jgi:hypothetical protein